MLDRAGCQSLRAEVLMPFVDACERLRICRQLAYLGSRACTFETTER
jgi:hypothetical protein